MAEEDKKTTITKTLTLRHDIKRARKLTEQIKEGFANHKAIFTIKARSSIESGIGELEKTLESLDRRTKIIEEQTRPLTGWQKVKEYIFSGVVGWIIAAVFGLTALLLGLNVI